MNIRQKFITLLLLIGVVPMLVVSVVAYFSFTSSLLNKTTDQLSSTATRQEQEISAFLQSKQEEVTKLSNRYDLQVMLRQYVASPTAENRTQLEAILLNKKNEIQDIQSIFLTDLKGKLLVSASDVTRDQLKSIASPTSGEETSVTVSYDTMDGFSKLYITTYVSINRQRTAQLNFIFRTDDLVAIVQDYTGLDETGETVVAGKNNLSLFPLRFQTDVSAKTDLSSLDLQETSDVSHYVTDYRGKEVLVLSHQIGLTDLTVATKIDKDEAFASIVALQNNMSLIVGSVIVIIIVVAAFLTRLFTRPILQVGRVSERIGKGDFTARANIVRRDEIGTLATSVNAMGQNLKELVGNIESQRQRLQVILDSTTEAIFAIDAEARVIVANKASQQLLFVDPKTLVGKKMDELFAWSQGLQPFTVDYRVEDVHTYSDLEYSDVKGNPRYVQLIVAPVREVGGTNSPRAIVTIHDETSSHELENMKTDFVSMAAHELRTPLTAVRGYLEMVQYKGERNDTKDVDSYVRQALKNVSDLSGLINNLLDVSRIERGTLTLSMDKVDIAADLARAIEDLRFITKDRKINLTYVGPVKDCFVVGDQVALHEIINNLLSNAVKYTREGGRVEVDLTRKGSDYIVDVKDTGIGIPSNALSHLFTKFYRVHGGLDSGSTGTGLGLFISKSIIERHQGTISVASKEGVGSTFTFTLPIYTKERLARMQPRDSEDNNAPTARRKRGWITKNITR